MVDRMNLYQIMQRLRLRLQQGKKATISAAKLRWKRFYRISVTREQYEKLRTDEDFINSIQLSRLVNVIRAAQSTFLRIPNDGNLINTRDRIEFQYLYSSIVYEATGSLLDLGGKLKHLKAWQANADLTKELNQLRSTATSYYRQVLAPIRNTVMFHFDREAVTEALSILTVKDRMDLLVSETRLNKDMLTPLAGNLVLNYVLSKDPGNGPGFEKFDYWMKYVTETSSKVIAVANACIIEIWTRTAKRTHERLEN
jgi:hypothetical protein